MAALRRLQIATIMVTLRHQINTQSGVRSENESAPCENPGLGKDLQERRYAAERLNVGERRFVCLPALLRNQTSPNPHPVLPPGGAVFVTAIESCASTLRVAGVSQRLATFATQNA
jgi:hypothetical protein